MNGVSRLSWYGRIVQHAWEDLPSHYSHIALDAFCIMPNHVHGIIILTEGSVKSVPAHALPEIVRAFKTFSARRVNTHRRTPGCPVWQRNFYEHIIRNETEWQRIRDYIDANPENWEKDQLHRD